MKIPNSCKDCPELNSILSTPVNSFAQNLEEITGQKVDSVGYPSTIRSLPNFAYLSSGRPATEAERSDAYWKTQITRDKIQRSIIEQIEDCPGLCDAKVEIEGIGTRTIRVCGKLAIENSVE